MSKDSEFIRRLDALEKRVADQQKVLDKLTTNKKSTTKDKK